MDLTSNVAPSSTATQRRPRHLRGNSFFRSFSGEPSKAPVYGRKRSNHKSTLTQSHIDKPSWDGPESLDTATATLPLLKQTPSVPPTHSFSSLPFSLKVDFSGLGVSPQSNDSPGEQQGRSQDLISSQWERETTTELNRVSTQSDYGAALDQYAFPSQNIARHRPLSPAASSKSVISTGHAKQLSTSSEFSSASGPSISLINPKHNSTVSTTSTLRHFSFISVDCGSSPLSAASPTEDDYTQTPNRPNITPLPSTKNLASINDNESYSSPLHDDHDHLIIPPSPQSIIPSTHKPLSASRKKEFFIETNPPALVFNSPVQIRYPSHTSPHGRNITPSSMNSALSNMSSPISMISTTSFKTTPNFAVSENQSSQISFKDDTRLAQYYNGSNATMLSYKKDKIKYRKNVSKTSISLPKGLVDCETHFTSAPDAEERSYESKHRSRNSVMASISTNYIFKPFKRDASPTRPYPVLKEPRTPQATSSSAHLSVKRLSPTVVNTAKKNSFADMRKLMAKSPTNIIFRGSSSNTISSRKSFLGMPSISFPSTSSGESSGMQKTIISLPTPNETSREKLKNKLRASSSLMSLTRPDKSGSLAIAVPFEQHNISQMEKLLRMCKIPSIMSFQAHTNQARALGDLCKLNEATHCEVFLQKGPNPGSSRVYKIIPFGNEELDQTPIEDILQELSISKLVTGLDGFVNIIDVAVVKGKYPAYLLSQWDKFSSRNKSENVRPDLFTESQLYCIIVQSDAGMDLKRYELESWTDAESIFWQTVTALAQAEERSQFEHRDLHWGNILITDNSKKEARQEDILQKLASDEPGALRTPLTSSSPQNNSSLVNETRNWLKARSTLKITLIDYTLSRTNSPEGVTLHTRMDHPEFYRGKGDYQFEIYRYMRSYIMAHNTLASSAMPRSASVSSSAGCAESESPINPDYSANIYLSPHTNTGSSSTISTPNTATLATFRDADEVGVDWSSFCPRTNVLWLHYLVDKLLNHKGLSPMTTGRSGRLVSRSNHSSPSLRDVYVGEDAASSNGNLTVGAGTTTTASMTTSGAGAVGGGGGSGSDRISTFEGDLLADEARAYKCLETILRTLDPRKKRMGVATKKSYGGSSVTIADFSSANDVLRWGIKAKVFPAYASLRTN